MQDGQHFHQNVPHSLRQLCSSFSNKNIFSLPELAARVSAV